MSKSFIIIIVFLMIVTITFNILYVKKSLQIYRRECNKNDCQIKGFFSTIVVVQKFNNLPTMTAFVTNNTKHIINIVPSIDDRDIEYLRRMCLGMLFSSIIFALFIGLAQFSIYGQAK